MVDSLLVKPDSSNCFDDGDNFILTLGTITSGAAAMTTFDDVPLAPQHQENDIRLAFGLPSGIP
jgi:hypothetical protein